MTELTVISLGWGVQSWGMAAMSALGELPSVDFAVHADTGWEHIETYKFAEKWTPWLEERGVKVATTQYKHAGKILNPRGGINFPVHTTYENGEPSGIMHRQCTRDWKLGQIKRWLSKELKRRGLTKTPGVVEKWLGISLDEKQRARESSVQYINNRWPLLEKEWTRQDVIAWLKVNKLGIPIQSSCVCCPLQSNSEWIRMKNQQPEDWNRAVRVDEKIRHIKQGYVCYLHYSKKPLKDVFEGEV